MTAIRAGGAGIFYIKTADNSRYFFGDQVVLTQGGNSVVFGLPVDTFSNNPDEITLLEKYVISGTSSFTAGATITIHEVNTVFLFDPNANYLDIFPGMALELCYDRDYDLLSTIIDGKTVNYIQLVPGFESNFATYNGAGYSLNDDCKIYYRTKQNPSILNHADVLEHIILQSGLSIDSTSFAAAESTNLITDFVYPQFGDGSLVEFRGLLQQFLQATLGMITVSSDFEIKYSLTNTPTASDEITDREILADSFSQKISYTDLASIIIAKNPDGYSLRGPGLSSASDVDPDFVTTYKSYSVPKSTSSHEVEKQIEFRQMIQRDSFETYILDKMKAIYSERFLTVSLETKSINFETEINDDVTIITNKLLGQTKTRNMTVIEVDKQREKVKLTLTDFLNI